MKHFSIYENYRKMKICMYNDMRPIALYALLWGSILYNSAII